MQNNNRIQNRLSLATVPPLAKPHTFHRIFQHHNLTMLASRQAFGVRRAVSTTSSSRQSCVVHSKVSISKRVVLARAEVAGPVTDETFAQLVLQSNVPVLVDFWAPWCGPCRMIAPIVDELATEYGDKLKCVKLNTDESPNVASEYGIRSIPTVSDTDNSVGTQTSRHV